MPYKDKERQNEYQRERIARRREDYFSDKHCIVCGTTDNLELDHIDPAKKVSHSIWSWSEEHRAIELAKCQVLCHDCHVKKTKRDMGYGLIHGTPAGYRYYECRCQACTAANTRKTNEYRWRTGKRKKRSK